MCTTEFATPAPPAPKALMYAPPRASMSTTPTLMQGEGDVHVTATERGPERRAMHRRQQQQHQQQSQQQRVQASQQQRQEQSQS